MRNIFKKIREEWNSVYYPKYKSWYFSLHLCSFMLSVALWVFVFQAEFDRISGKEGPVFSLLALILAGSFGQSGRVQGKNGSELGYSTWLLLNEDYPLPPSYHHGFFFSMFIVSEGVLSTRSHCKILLFPQALQTIFT